MTLDPESPISNEALEFSASDVSKLWKRVRGRAPREVNRRVRAALEQVFALVNADELQLPARLRVTHELDALSHELHGRAPFDPQFYRNGKLAIVTAYDPIRIRGAVDHVAIEQRFDRYLSSAERAHARLSYFLERAGVLLEEKKTTGQRPWEQPYGKFEAYREFLWGRVSRNNVPPGGKR
ncbi:MAG: hypothetical protein ACI9MR_002091 [Myxococcota bacterium]